jgi:uncharacterized protein (DUF952 family)
LPNPPHPELIYKIVPLAAWRSACSVGIYAGSSDDLRDGFIHFSTAAQLAETARRHFSGQSDLLLVAVSTATLGQNLKWEPSRGGALFPHLHAPLDTKTAVWSRHLDLRTDGVPDIAGALSQGEK